MSCQIRQILAVDFGHHSLEHIYAEKEVDFYWIQIQI